MKRLTLFILTFALAAPVLRADDTASPSRDELVEVKDAEKGPNREKLMALIDKYKDRGQDYQDIQDLLNSQDPDFSSADKVRFIRYKDEERLDRIIFTVGGKEWIFYAPKPGVGAFLIRKSALMTPGSMISSAKRRGTQFDFYVMRTVNGKLVAVQVDREIAHKPRAEGKIADLAKKPDGFDGSSGGDDGGSSVDGSSGAGSSGSGLKPSAHARTLNIADSGMSRDEARSSGHDFYVDGTGLRRVSDGEEIGYKVAGVDTWFVHNGAPPADDGTHKDSEAKWVLYGKNGKIIGDYAKLDLVRKKGDGSNVGKFKEAGKEVTRMDLVPSVVEIKVHDPKDLSAAPQVVKAFRFKAEDTAGGKKALAKYSGVDGAAYKDEKHGSGSSERTLTVPDATAVPVPKGGRKALRAKTAAIPKALMAKLEEAFQLKAAQLLERGIEVRSGVAMIAAEIAAGQEISDADVELLGAASSDDDLGSTQMNAANALKDLVTTKDTSARAQELKKKALTEILRSLKSNPKSAAATVFKPYAPASS